MLSETGISMPVHSSTHFLSLPFAVSFVMCSTASLNSPYGLPLHSGPVVTFVPLTSTTVEHTLTTLALLSPLHYFALLSQTCPTRISTLPYCNHLHYCHYLPYCNHLPYCHKLALMSHTHFSTLHTPTITCQQNHMCHITNGQVANSVSVGGANFTAVPLSRAC
jgi:hypothetical protein